MAAIEWRQSGTARSYADVPAGANVVSVNGRDVVGFCEGCGKAILEGQRHEQWAEGIVTHLTCPTNRDAR